MYLVTQRSSLDKYGVPIDYLERPYLTYFRQFTQDVFLVPNDTTAVAEYFTDKVKGVILTGGNNLLDRNEQEEQRYQVECALLKEAINRNIPVLGICSGMQTINLFFGGSLQKIDGHVRVDHKVTLLTKQDVLGDRAIVNSYHNHGVTDLAQELVPLAQAEDGSTEAFYYKEKQILGIIWHPERKSVEEKYQEEFALFNQKVLKTFFMEGKPC